MALRNIPVASKLQSISSRASFTEEDSFQSWQSNFQGWYQRSPNPNCNRTWRSIHLPHQCSAHCLPRHRDVEYHIEYARYSEANMKFHRHQLFSPTAIL